MRTEEVSCLHIYSPLFFCSSAKCTRALPLQIQSVAILCDFEALKERTVQAAARSPSIFFFCFAVVTDNEASPSAHQFKIHLTHKEMFSAFLFNLK